MRLFDVILYFLALHFEHLLVIRLSDHINHEGLGLTDVSFISLTESEDFHNARVVPVIFLFLINDLTFVTG